ncbi:glutamine amidotransferase [Candidatus Saccharibacteria bacterium TM7i]|nr:glutamine amidotransferase [Candidatus Saccharibacteria bacterium TM7i]
MSKKPVITILHLYPRDMNIYGDNGNVQVLVKRLEWHGYTPSVIEYNPEDTLPNLSDIDLIIGGGGQDSGQNVIHQDLLSNGKFFRNAADDGLPMLLVCGLYQLFGNSFTTHTGTTLEGIRVFNTKTIGGKERLVGNITLESETFGTIIGYENHSGQTYFEEPLTPLGLVRIGAGNNTTDDHEGVLYKNVIGTYLHGSLLPKNPAIADYLISTAAKRRYGEFNGQSIDDSIAMRARTVALTRPR